MVERPQRYEKISELKAAIATAHYPNTCAMALKLSNGNALLCQQLIDDAKSCIQPAYDYFNSRFDGELKIPVSAFKAARYFDPSKINELKPTLSDIDSLKVLPFIKNPLITNLKTELPAYMSKAEDVLPTVSKTEWWKKHAQELPFWSSACKSILLLQPSSAAAERVFSLLNNSFKEQQYSSLEDYIETSIMLQYNEK